jgi:O-antigen ligase
VGAGNFQYRYMDFQYRFMPNRTLETRELHNMYLSVAVQTGGAGLVCFGGMLLASLSGLTRVMRENREGEARDYAEAVHFGFALFLIACFFSPMTTNKLTWILSGIAAALPIVADGAKKHTQSESLAGSAAPPLAVSRW